MWIGVRVWCGVLVMVVIGLFLLGVFGWMGVCVCDGGGGDSFIAVFMSLLRRLLC